uniref:Uncharacterized protein n=1 Tax=Parascaris equorum TaxID=6256 RepID=A0A914R7Z0_PAREQ
MLSRSQREREILLFVGFNGLFFQKNAFLFKECIQLAACSEDELLPMDPDLPADLFTSCLTTPIQISILWYIVKNDLKDRFPLSIVEKIPGQLTDRRTLLGELNWIFTAITDTIAWNALPKELFQKLFRLVSSFLNEI